MVKEALITLVKVAVMAVGDALADRRARKRERDEVLRRWREERKREREAD